jgi:hypothetical protein
VRRGIVSSAVVAVIACAVAFGASARATANTDFRGMWTTPANGNWTITRENLKTGVCAGKSGFAGYTLTGCRVTGKHYVFVVRQTGTAYRSNNAGTISGNTVHGTFSDNAGHKIAYVATRKPKK